MTKKSAITITPYWLFVIGEWVGGLKNELEQSTPSSKVTSEYLAGLSTLKDTKNFEFIGKQADSWFSDFYKKYHKQEKECLDSEDHERLKRIVTRWEGRFQEISKNWILSYPDTYIDAGKLTKGVEAFLNDDEFNALELLEKQSLNEATSSLLFNNFTSAEFMALRTAESLLKRWYEKRTNKKLGRTTWGEVLEKVSEEFPREQRPKELLLLDYLRERRNEIAHPEAVSNSMAASTTFLNVISLCESLT